ncbi:MAG: hypothetical protein K6A45_06565 [Lachnospiraceae bacterium]|nr:hypothetical protein [Lachnospiraceae bacterium]
MPIIIAVCAAAFLGLFLYKIYIRFRLQDKCVGTTVAHFLYPVWKGELCGRYVRAQWNPVFEYSVDNTIYTVELEIYAHSKKFPNSETEVKYLPEDPQVCFINGNRGKILNARNNTEYIEKEFNDEKQI